LYARSKALAVEWESFALTVDALEVVLLSAYAARVRGSMN
jgi:hypothetical protein